MGQLFGQRVLAGETGSATETVRVGPGDFLCLELGTISGTVEVLAGLQNLTPIGLKNALTEAVEGDASATGLWWAFVSPYTKVTISAVNLGASDEIWVGVQ